MVRFSLILLLVLLLCPRIVKANDLSPIHIDGQRLEKYAGTPFACLRSDIPLLPGIFGRLVKRHGATEFYPLIAEARESLFEAIRKKISNFSADSKRTRRKRLRIKRLRRVLLKESFRCEESRPTQETPSTPVPPAVPQPAPIEPTPAEETDDSDAPDNSPSPPSLPFEIHGCVRTKEGLGITALDVTVNGTHAASTGEDGCFQLLVFGQGEIKPRRVGFEFIPPFYAFGTSSESPFKADFIATWESPIGTNLAAIEYWSSALPFKDLMKMRSDFFLQGAAPELLQLDSNGYPLRLPSGAIAKAHLMLHNGGRYEAGAYLALFDGEGDLGFGLDAQNVVRENARRYRFSVPEPKSGIEVSLTRISEGNHIRNLRIIPARFEADYQEQQWHPQFLKNLSGYGVLRFMDWMRVSHKVVKAQGNSPGPNSLSAITLASNASVVPNAYVGMVIESSTAWERRLISAYDANTRAVTVTPPFTTVPAVNSWYGIQEYSQREWSDRTSATAHQSKSSGVSIEAMVDLSNTLHVNPWFCMPTAASDDYVRQFATYVRDHLAPGLTAIVEWSNETWNGPYPGAVYASAYGATLGIGAWDYHALRATEVFNIWSDVFGEARLRSERIGPSRVFRALASQAAWLGGPGLTIMDFDGRNLPAGYQNPIASGRRAHDYADGIAIAPYFGGGLSTSDFVGKSSSELFNLLRSEVELRYESGNPVAWVKNYAAAAKERGLKLVAYEGGQHLAAETSANYVVGSVRSAESASVRFEDWQSAIDGAYTGKIIEIKSSTGEIQRRNISAYIGATRMALLDSAWSRIPAAGERFLLRTPAQVVQDDLNRDPRMSELYKLHLSKWRSLASEFGASTIGWWTHFQDVAAWGSFGRWGSMEWYGQELAGAPKAQALVDLRTEWARWW